MVNLKYYFEKTNAVNMLEQHFFSSFGSETVKFVTIIAKKIARSKTELSLIDIIATSGARVRMLRSVQHAKNIT